jgi:hypothetical protein
MKSTRRVTRELSNGCQKWNLACFWISTGLFAEVFGHPSPISIESFARCDEIGGQLWAQQF